MPGVALSHLSYLSRARALLKKVGVLSLILTKVMQASCRERAEVLSLILKSCERSNYADVASFLKRWGYRVININRSIVIDKKVINKITNQLDYDSHI